MAILAGMTTPFAWLRSASSRRAVVRRLSQLKEYLVEFRSIHDAFRLSEFRDCARCAGYTDTVEFQPVIVDPLFKEPVCAYVQLPNDSIAQQITHRSASVRNIIEVWGDETCLENLVQSTTTKYFDSFRHHFENLNSEQNTWRVNFRTYGRAGYSGLDYKQKVDFLKNFNAVFLDINGTVNLQNPTTKFIYLEDWTEYQNFSNDLYKASLKSDLQEDLRSAKERIESLQPKRRIFGRQVAKGPKIASTYDVRYRPYIGTTTMEATIAHIAANAGSVLDNYFADELTTAARVMPGETVLDPFCGTGGLLLPCCHLGAIVTGSDIDADCLGLVDRGILAVNNRSKNSNFIRQNGYQNLQMNGSTRSNFEFYGFESQLQDLHAMDASEWLSDNRVETYDVIVSDPPFGIRERSLGDESRHPLVTLLEIANKRLKCGGRLAFWMPTEAYVEERDVFQRLKDYSNQIYSFNLRFVRATRQELSSKLERWLCLFERC